MKRSGDLGQVSHKPFVFIGSLGINLLLSFAALFAASSVAQACLGVTKDRGYGYFRQAEVILIAEVVSYAIAPERDHPVFELDTIRVISGPVVNARPRWRVEWTNSAFGEPKEWKGPKFIIVGLRAEINENGQPMIRIVHHSCFLTNSLVPASEENLQTILRDSGISPAPARLKNIPWP